MYAGYPVVGLKNRLKFGVLDIINTWKYKKWHFGERTPPKESPLVTFLALC
jgi:hypothetical protein